MLVFYAARNRNHFLGCVISGHAIDSTGEYPFILSTKNVQRVTSTRGEFSLILDYSYKLDILGLLCHVATLKRRDVVTSRCQFELLWNAATLISNVATLILNASGTSRRGYPTSRR